MTTLHERGLAAYKEHEATRTERQAATNMRYKEVQITSIALWLKQQFDVVLKREEIVPDHSWFNVVIDEQTYRVFIFKAGEADEDIYMQLPDGIRDIRDLVSLGEAIWASAYQETGY